MQSEREELTVRLKVCLAVPTLLQVPDRSKEMSCPFVGGFPVGAEYNPEIRMQGVKLGNGFGTKARGVVVHFFGIQEIGIGGFDYQCMVILGCHLGQPLVQHRHCPEVGKDVIECLAFHYSQHPVPIHKRIITNGDISALDESTREMPGIALIAVDTNNHFGTSLARYELKGRAVLLD